MERLHNTRALLFLVAMSFLTFASIAGNPSKESCAPRVEALLRGRSSVWKSMDVSVTEEMPHAFEIALGFPPTAVRFVYMWVETRGMLIPGTFTCLNNGVTEEKTCNEEGIFWGVPTMKEAQMAWKVNFDQEILKDDVVFKALAGDKANEIFYGEAMVFGRQLDEENPYEGCGVTKKCFGCVDKACVESAGCIQGRNCDKFLSYVPAKEGETSINVTVMRTGADDDSYVAIGLSEDAYMGEQGGVSQIWTSYENGSLKCAFTHDLVTRSSLGGTLNLTSTAVHLLLAVGNTTGSENNLSKHTSRGISSKHLMTTGRDGVVECVYEGGQINVNIYRSYNIGKDTPVRNQRLPQDEQAVMISEKVGIFEDGVVRCGFTLPAGLTYNAMTFNLNNSTYNVLVAVGVATAPSENGTGNVGFHTIAFGASAEPVDFFGVSTPQAASNNLILVHGISMVLAWVFFASSGIITARYFKKTWVGTQVCKKDMWFTIHRGFMVTAWALTIVGFFCILAHKDWEFLEKPHHLVGVVSVVLCFIQPFMALLRPHPEDPNRPIFNWVHWGVGTGAHGLAGLARTPSECPKGGLTHNACGCVEEMPSFRFRKTVC
ncbi:unnamed protein product [Darwinula stevensoni]|uniref:Cytochrome b561 domain-containing protein n=1 Tax=Darwinula stevensoni TaxID=69355 RepID=A0A7R8X2M2_9CRUS|nr:unnamed protein product [Darwinula stevensoni]CAG0883463.1 unnamed protein product [Darwinula stevensoni]